MPKDNEKASNKNVAGSHSLTGSPYVGGRKMSSSLIDKLKRFKKHSIPISRASTSDVSARSIQLEMLAEEYSKEDIENAMNEIEPEINKRDCSNAKETEEHVLNDNKPDLMEISSNSKEDIDIYVDKNLSNAIIKASSSKEDKNAIIGSDSNEFVEITIEVSGSDENESDTSFLNDDNENDVDKSGAKLNENVHSFTKENFVNGKDGSDSKLNDKVSCSSKEKIDNCMDESAIKINENTCSYLMEDIEKCVDKESVLKIFHDLQKEYAENQEKLRKLKLVQKHHAKNSPEALKSLNQKWLTCTQLALRKLYNFMPEPRNITFEAFLVFLQVDFDAVRYNPETDSFV